MSFRNRLALFLMATLVCVQAATAFLAYAYLRQQVVKQGSRDLSAAMQAFTRQIDLLSRRAQDGVQVLALDFALRSAIARSDHGTEVSVLRNHGRRIGAARMILIRLDGSIAADTAGAAPTGTAFPFPAVLSSAATGERGTALITWGNGIDWIVVAPVRAPVPIAFIAACIPLDDALLEQLRGISSSPHGIALVWQRDNGRWKIAAHTRDAAGSDLRLADGNRRGTMLSGRGGSEVLAIVAPLHTAPGSRPIKAIIEFPLSQALRAYSGIISPMLILLAFALLIAASGTTVIVRRLTRPLESLAAVAQRIAAGDYSAPNLQRSGGDELGRLATAVTNMTNAIADREKALTGAMEATELARLEAVKANEAKSHFLANMSHELRTPLNAVVGFGEMLEGEVLGPLGSPRYLEYARHIRESGQKLRALVERMLDLAQAQSGRLEISREVVQPGALVREAVEMHRGLALDSRVALTVSSLPQDAHVAGDALKLRQALSNVVHNAIRFTPPGGTVAVSAVGDGERLKLCVSDTGGGINPELLKSVGRPFQRLRSALDGRQQGAGIGLAFAVAIVERHGGSLSLASRMGEGTTVTIELPLAREVIGNAA